MASFLNKIRMKSATNKIDYKDFSHSHLTTQNFCQIMPITNTELIPNSHVECTPSTFCRFEPMPQPTFMDVDIVNRAFFVPYELVWRPFHAFITKKPYMSSDGVIHPLEVPKLDMHTLVRWFVGHMIPSPNANEPYATDEEMVKKVKFGQNVGQNTPDQHYDFFVPQCSGNVYASGFRLSSLGRFVLKILSSLGYKIDTTQYTDDVTLKGHVLTLSALPLLCYSKIFIDWYYPSQYVNFTTEFNNVESILRRESSYTLSIADLENIFLLVTKFFSEDSYFVNAFDFPVTQDAMYGTSEQNSSYLTETIQQSPLFNGQYANEVAPNYSNSDYPSIAPAAIPTEYGTSDKAEPGNNNLTQTNNALTNWAVSAVSRLGSWLKRNQLAGAKVIDTFLARYGVQLPSEKINRCYYLGEQRFQAMFSDVMSTAETSDGSLGDYAGKGVAFNDNKTFTFDTDEFGQFIVTNVVYPHVTYTQGYDRQLTHINAFDFYQPEFDGLGFVPVTKGELITPSSPEDFGWKYLFTNHVSGEELHTVPSNFTTDNVDPSLYQNLHREVFGFMPRYVEMKVPRDRQTGNFAMSGIPGIQSWTPTRYFKLFDFNADSNLTEYIDVEKNYIPDLVHSPRFMQDDGRQYLRLFYSDANRQDSIIFRHYFRMSINAPILPLYDTFEFDNEQHKKDITIAAQGSKLS